MKLPRLAVYGLLAKQARQLVETFRGRADVVAVSKDDAVTQVPRADFHLLAKDFIGHSLQEKVVAEAGREKVLAVRGSVTGFIVLIDRILGKINGSPPENH